MIWERWVFRMPFHMEMDDGDAKQFPLVKSALQLMDALGN